MRRTRAELFEAVAITNAPCAHGETTLRSARETGGAAAAQRRAAVPARAPYLKCLCRKPPCWPRVFSPAALQLRGWPRPASCPWHGGLKNAELEKRYKMNIDSQNFKIVFATAEKEPSEIWQNVQQQNAFFDRKMIPCSTAGARTRKIAQISGQE